MLTSNVSGVVRKNIVVFAYCMYLPLALYYKLLVNICITALLASKAGKSSAVVVANFKTQEKASQSTDTYQ